MMTTRLLRALCFTCLLALLLAPAPALHAQGSVNTTQQLSFAGLRSSGMQGQINGVAADSAGNLYFVLDQKDGVRVLKTDNSATTVLSQALLGASGDVGLALTLNSAGQVFVTGTTTSTSLTATPGAAIPQRTDSSTNSFVAGFDANLKPLFVTFTGGSRISSSAIAATADSVFVTGLLYGSNLPVTANGILQAPASGSSGNGFVERFSLNGSTLVYATYLTGASGDTTPAAIAADPSDAAYIAGSTTASGYPTVAALVPLTLSNPSGFLTRLTPAGDGITFSTFIPGGGLTSLALDPNGSTLLASGSVASGQFPVTAVSGPLLPIANQVLLKLPLDGSSVQGSVALAPGTQSHVASAPGSVAWVDGLGSLPLLPGTPLAGIGAGFALRVTAGNTIDQSARFGGLTTSNSSYSSLPLRLTSIAVDPSGAPLVAGAVLPTASSSLLGTQTYDLPLLSTPTSALPSTLRNAEQSASTCSGSLCAGSAAYLARLNPSGTGAALALSVDDAPFATLRNLGSAQATGLVLTSSAGAPATTCGSTLAAGGECRLIVPGTAASTLTATAGNAATQQVAIPASAAQSSTIVFTPRELDFGIVSAGAPAIRTIIVTNLGTAPQTFSSTLDASGTGSPFSEGFSDCQPYGALTKKLLAAGATCHIQIALTASSTASAGGLQGGNWLIGTRDVLLTGFTQATAATLSASELDFGTQYAGGLRLPRFLYLYNNASSGLAHTPATLPSGSPFTVTDSCPSVLAAGQVCGIRVDYLSPTPPSKDSATLTLDSGTSVLLTGQQLPARTATGSTSNPNLSVTPTSISFTNAVVVTGVSSTTQNVAVTNTGNSPFALSLTLSGDFTDVTSCGATLAGGQTCSVAISFAPSQPGPRSGVLAVTAGAGTSPVYVSLAGTGTAILPANDGTLDFGGVFVAQPRVQFLKVAQPFSSLSVNTTGPYTVTLVEDIGYGYGHPSAAAYTTSLTGSCSNCYLAVRFLPSATGPQPGTLALSSAAGGSTYTVALTGQGLPATGLLLSAVAQDFGTVPVHSMGGPVLFTVTNLSTSATPVTLAAPAVTGDFTLATTATGGQPCAGTLAYTASCQIAIQFSPSAAGSRTGTLTVTGGTGSASAVLTGYAPSDPGISIRPLSLTFSNVPGPSSTQQIVTVMNTGSATVQVGTVSTGTAAFQAASTCGTLLPSASCTVTVTYTAGAATTNDTLTIPTLSSMPGGNAVPASYTVALLGAYTAGNAGLQVVPGQLSFGPAPAGTEGSSRQFTVNNLTGNTLAVALTVPHNFALTGAPCTALAPNGSCTFEAEFVPLLSSDITGTVFVQGTPAGGGPTLTGIGYLAGYGTGTGSLRISGIQSGGLVLFGQVQSGQSASKTLTLTNIGPAGAPAVTVRRVTSAPPFLATTTCGAALASGQTCTVTLHYAPSNQVANGTSSPLSTTDTGLLTIESDASSSPDIVNLSGNGGPVAVASPSNNTPIATYTLSQTSLSFASVAVGNSTPAQTVSLTNTGTATLHVLSATSTSDYTVSTTCGTVLPGASCSFAVSSTPQTAGSHPAALAISTDFTSALEFVSLLSSSTPSTLTVTPASLSFGSVQVGSPSSLPVQVTNSGSSPVTLTGISSTGDYTTAGTCTAPGGTLAPGAYCTVQVTFTPATTGPRPGVLSIGSTASTLPLTVALSGTGIQSQLLVSPASISFGYIALGASANMPVTLTNSGTATVTALALTSTGDYAVTIPCPSTTLAPGASCTVQLTFTPTATGSRLGTLTVTSSDKSSPLTVQLTGIGTQLGSISLTVNSGPSAAATVKTGSPASFTLAVTPLGGFTGNVALTCAAVNPGTYMTCSLQPSTVALSGSTVYATATLNTITSAALHLPAAPGSNPLFPGSRPGAPGRTPLNPAWCLLIPFAFLSRWRRLKLPRSFHALGPLSLLWLFILITGCGRNGSGTNSSIHFTPPGTYQYTVTASSTTGVVVAQSVTLNVTVQ